MKSVVMAFSQFQTALSSALNFALTAVNTEQKFVWLFGSFAVTSWIVGTIFFFTYVFFRHLFCYSFDLNGFPFILGSAASINGKQNSTLSARVIALASMERMLILLPVRARPSFFLSLLYVIVTCAPCDLNENTTPILPTLTKFYKSQDHSTTN